MNLERTFQVSTPDKSNPKCQDLPKFPFSEGAGGGGRGLQTNIPEILE